MPRLHVHLPGPFSVSFGGRRRRARYGRAGGGGGCLGPLLALTGVLLVASVAIYAVLAAAGLLLVWWAVCSLVGAVLWLVDVGKHHTRHRPWPVPLNVQFWPLRFTREPEVPQVPAGWYPDPVYGEGLRWWDGLRWTEYLQAQPEIGQQGTGPAPPW